MRRSQETMRAFAAFSAAMRGARLVLNAELHLRHLRRQYAESAEPPLQCRICSDERQYVGFNGQHWTTIDALAETHENHFDLEEAGLVSIETRPTLPSAQRALLVDHPAGNVLWDCLTLVDQATVDRIADLGGLSAIAISHPHYYGASVDWSHAFGGVPIYINDADARWVCRRIR
jgi:hypothetical protein